MADDPKSPTQTQSTLGSVEDFIHGLTLGVATIATLGHAHQTAGILDAYTSGLVTGHDSDYYTKQEEADTALRRARGNSEMAGETVGAGVAAIIAARFGGAALARIPLIGGVARLAVWPLMHPIRTGIFVGLTWGTAEALDFVNNHWSSVGGGEPPAWLQNSAKGAGLVWNVEKGVGTWAWNTVAPDPAAVESFSKMFASLGSSPTDSKPTDPNQTNSTAPDLGEKKAPIDKILASPTFNVSGFPQADRDKASVILAGLSTEALTRLAENTSKLTKEQIDSATNALPEGNRPKAREMMTATYIASSAKDADAVDPKTSATVASALDVLKVSEAAKDPAVGQPLWLASTLTALAAKDPSIPADKVPELLRNNPQVVKNSDDAYAAWLKANPPAAPVSGTPVVHQNVTDPAWGQQADRLANWAHDPNSSNESEIVYGTDRNGNPDGSGYRFIKRGNDFLVVKGVATPGSNDLAFEPGRDRFAMASLSGAPGAGFDSTLTVLRNEGPYKLGFLVRSSEMIAGREAENQVVLEQRQRALEQRQQMMTGGQFGAIQPAAYQPPFPVRAGMAVGTGIGWIIAAPILAVGTVVTGVGGVFDGIGHGLTSALSPSPFGSIPNAPSNQAGMMTASNPPTRGNYRAAITPPLPSATPSTQVAANNDTKAPSSPYYDYSPAGGLG